MEKKKQAEIKLKVAEAIQDDVNKGIVRIDNSFMQQIGVRVGDIVEIEGERKTVAIADRAYPGDIGLNIIRTDGIVRRNARTGIGEMVKVRKADVKEAKKVTIAPARKGIMIRAPPDIFKQGLLGRTVIKGDIVSLGGTRRRRTTMMDNPFFEDVFSILGNEIIPGFGFGDIKFVVVDTNPKQAVIISDQTQVEFNPEAVEITEEKILEVTYEDIGGLQEEIKKIREMVELPLKHPEIFERLGIEPPKGVLLHGPPGCGKTLLAKAVANETNSHFILINGPEIMSKYYGQSLPAYERILIREKGLLKRVPIGDIVEKNKQDIEVVCFDKEGKVAVKKVSSLIKHKLNSKILEVRTASGRKIRVTDDHSLFTVGKEGINDIKTSQLKEGESYIAIPKVIPFNPNPIYELDLFDMLKEEDYGIVVRGVEDDLSEAMKKLGIKKVAKILGVREKYVYDIKSKNVGISVKKYYQLMKGANLNVNKDFLQLSTKGKSMPCRLRLTEDLMLFFGLWLAEGSYTNKDEVRLSINRSEEKFVADLCRKLFGMVTIYRKKNRFSSDVYICSGILGKVMKNVLGFNSGARNKKVPDFVYNLDKTNLSAFLRGYFSGDGSLNLKTPAPMVEVSTESQSLADDVAYLLLHFGIVAKIYPRKNRPQKRICFADYENLEKFMDIGFIDTEKNRAIANYLNLKKFSRRDQLPITEEIMKLVQSNPHLSAWRKSKTIGKNVLQKLIEPELAGLLNSDIKWDKVIEIKEVNENLDYVYDLSVPGAENFIAGFGGIYAHNSEENLRKRFEDAQKNAPSIIFIDEIDAIASKREETRGEVERRVVAQLLANMDGLQSRGKVVVIAATNVPNLLDPALRRPGRFDREIEIGVPSKEGRLNILKIHTRNMPLYTREQAVRDLSDIEDKYRQAIFELINSVSKNKLTKKILETKIQKFLKDHPDKNNLFKGIDSGKLYEYIQKGLSNQNLIDLDGIANITYGFVGADLSALAKEAAMIVLRRVLPDLKLEEEEAIPKEVLENLMITQKDFRESLKVVRPSALREVLIEKPSTKWTDIGGLEDVKQELIEAVEWPLKYPESFKRMGVKPPKGILLYGAPGTGKTLLARAVANESDANFISIKGPELLSKWIGESEKAVREVFKKARQTAPTIIFFDEIDALAPRRGAYSGTHVTETVVNQLLTEMDGLEEMQDVVVIAASNRPDIIDTSLLRPGRLDRIILAPVPDEKTRLEIFKVHTKGMPLKGVSLESLAKKTEGYVGADIEAVCREAAILALRKTDMKAKEVTTKFFDEALKKVGASSTKEVEKAYEDIGKQFSAAKGKQMKDEMPSYFG